LDLAFLILDMLAHHRVIFLDNHLFGHGSGVFLGDIEMARACGRVQTDLDGRRLRHGCSPASGGLATRKFSSGLPFTYARPRVNSNSPVAADPGITYAEGL